MVIYREPDPSNNRERSASRKSLSPVPFGHPPPVTKTFYAGGVCKKSAGDRSARCVLPRAVSVAHWDLAQQPSRAKPGVWPQGWRYNGGDQTFRPECDMFILRQLAPNRVFLTLLLVSCTPSIEPESDTRFLSPSDPRVSGMVFVPAGPFIMGSTEQDIQALYESYGGSRALYESEFPQRIVTLDDFYIDRTEVTQTQYKIFVDDTHRPVPYVNREWASLYNWERGTFPEGMARHPVVLVSWDDANAYCDWAGKSLPSEEEWGKAGRGMGGQSYPWGNQWDRTILNSSSTLVGGDLSTIEEWTDWWRDSYNGELRARVVTTVPVGSYPSGASPHGALDMAGNVSEWTENWFDSYPDSPYPNPQFGTTYRTIRGGDWYLDRIYTRAAARLRSPPDHLVPTIGFRCVCRKEDVARVPEG